MSLIASAGELSPSFDRGGLGESTGTPGAGHAIIAGAVTVGLQPTTATIHTVTARVGVAKGLELRATLPSLIIAEDITTGPARLGLKVAASASEHLSVSAVPELLIEPTSGQLAGYVSANIKLSAGVLGIWGQSAVTVSESVPQLESGLALSVGDRGHAAYIHGMAGYNAPDFVGGGGWIRVAPTVQVDLGCDVMLESTDLQPVFTAGIAAGF